MNKQIELLRYLRKEGADIEEKNINSILNKLGLRDETLIYKFLNDLEKAKYIEWRDARPQVPHSSPSILMFLHDENSPYNYQAEITLPGLQYLREDELKIYSKWLTIFSVIVAIITALIGWYYSNAAKDKDEEIGKLKTEKTSMLAIQKTKIDSINALKFNLSKIKSFSEHLKKDSLSAFKPIRR
ncbi:hypothetical protein GCM10028808_40400 [Spirosoma migulaei]